MWKRGEMMILYLAAAAQGNETNREHGMLLISNRLLSYHLVATNSFDNRKVFLAIKKYKEVKNEDQQSGITDSIRKG
jgi:hypothetical protein